MLRITIRALLVAGAMNIWSVSVMGQSCRPLDERVVYSYDPGHVLYRETAVVLKASLTNNLLSLLISVPSQKGNQTRTDFLSTTDDGRTWRQTVESPSPLALPSSPLAAAPSNLRVQYKLHSAHDVYLRSDDEGKTWTKPANKIRETSPSLPSTEDMYASFSLAAIHPTDPHRLYATIKLFPKNSGSRESTPIELGLYESKDGAESWGRITSIVAYGAAVGIDSSNPSFMFTQSTGGVVKTTDGGVTWSPVGHQKQLSALPAIHLSGEESKVDDMSPIVTLKVTQVAIDPRSDKDVYLVTNKGVYRSRDAGNDWCLLSLGTDIIDSANSLAFDPKDTSSIFVGTRLGVFHSLDRGERFKRIYPSVR